jgi:NADP-dependent 3-hydroxy acid dehydrogenase YdfG
MDKKVICITGGANGLGRAIVARFSKDCQIIILDYDESTAASTAQQFNCDYQVCDVSDYQSVKKAVDYIIDKYHQIDYLINNAGTYINGEIDDNDPVKLKQVIDVNVVGQMNLCKYVVPQMKKQKEGTIINVNSTASHYPKALDSVYHASKYACQGFTESLQLDLSPYGIKVISLCPGLMDTNFKKEVVIDRSIALSLDSVVDAVEFVLSCRQDVYIPLLIIKHI